MKNAIVWLALGLAVGSSLTSTRPPRPMTWAECLDSTFGPKMDHENVEPDNENGVRVTITSSNGKWLSWSLYPEEARQFADYLNDSADAAERAAHVDGGTEL